MEFNLKYKLLEQIFFHVVSPRKKMCFSTIYVCTSVLERINFLCNVHRWASSSVWALKCRFQKYIKISETSLKIHLSKTVTILLSRKPCPCSLTSIIKHSLPSIKTSCLLICLHVSVEAEGCHHLVYNPPIQLCFNIHNDVKHAYLIYYLVIFPQ